ncbi:hypothetical protein HDV01_003400 [Terramyces sp. JEL0728]|nr:hypothetical protein HDV01_003400 [Terramyces sp. JEL0728]
MLARYLFVLSFVYAGQEFHQETITVCQPSLTSEDNLSLGPCDPKKTAVQYSKYFYWSMECDWEGHDLQSIPMSDGGGCATAAFSSQGFNTWFTWANNNCYVKGAKDGSLTYHDVQTKLAGTNLMCGFYDDNKKNYFNYIYYVATTVTPTTTTFSVVPSPTPSNISWTETAAYFWSFGCDFFKDDFSIVNTNDLTNCANQCSTTPSCSHFAYKVTYCLLKNGTVSKTDAIPLIDANNSTGCGIIKPSLIWNLGQGYAWRFACDWSVNDIKAATINTPDDCANECKNTATCTHYTFNGQNCFLKKGSVTIKDAYLYNDVTQSWGCGVLDNPGVSTTTVTSAPTITSTTSASIPFPTGQSYLVGKPFSSYYLQSENSGYCIGAANAVDGSLEICNGMLESIDTFSLEQSIVAISSKSHVACLDTDGQQIQWKFCERKPSQSWVTSEKQMINSTVVSYSNVGYPHNCLSFAGHRGNFTTEDGWKTLFLDDCAFKPTWTRYTRKDGISMARNQTFPDSTPNIVFPPVAPPVDLPIAKLPVRSCFTIHNDIDSDSNSKYMAKVLDSFNGPAPRMQNMTYIPEPIELSQDQKEKILFQVIANKDTTDFRIQLEFNCLAVDEEGTIVMDNCVSAKKNQYFKIGNVNSLTIDCISIDPTNQFSPYICSIFSTETSKCVFYDYNSNSSGTCVF